MTTRTPEFLMLGAGGHAKVLHGLLSAKNITLSGVIDPELALAGTRSWRGIPVLGDDDALLAMDVDRFALVNGVGHTPRSTQRREVYRRARQLGFRFPPLVHPATWVCASTVLSDGVQIMAGAVIQPDCRIGENSLINTGSSVDHDCAIGDHTHIAPGVTICGNVRIGDDCFVGAGSTIIQGLRIVDDSLIRAGTVVIKKPVTQVTSQGGL
jgi:sugar O-acyltransferase (sialic acid O-acetyltransferase NeuD family)